MNIVFGAVQLGFIYAFLGLGIYIVFRIMDTPDLTADGSFTTGLCVSVICARAGHPFAGLVLGLIAGAAAGTITGLLHTKAGIHPILAGILTMTALYSVNLFILGGSPNVSLIGKDTLFSLVQKRLPGLDRHLIRLIITGGCCFVALICLQWFFRTGLGLQIRATGNNDTMVRASSINADAMRVTATALANAFIGLSGALLAQYQGYADINSGAGTVIVGLASVIIGETFLRSRSVSLGLVSAALGSLIYRLLIALVLYLDFFPAFMLKGISAAIVALALASPRIQTLYTYYRTRNRHHAHYR
jgi:putative ABC transport system permease protein